MSGRFGSSSEKTAFAVQSRALGGLFALGRFLREGNVLRRQLLAGIAILGLAGIAVVAAAGTASQTKDAPPNVDPRKAFGSKNAPVTMEVFSDFQCPACRTLYMSVWRQLLENYVNTGKVYLIHRDFPLPSHAHSRDAARYANAAAQIGKFEAVEQVLFEKQDAWAASGDVDGVVAGILTATQMAKVRALVKGGTLDAGIDRDVASGQNRRVNQTPTCILTCKGQTYPVVGPQSYEVFHAFLDQLLKQ
jgi:protein-disulfide isomerase